MNIQRVVVAVAAVAIAATPVAPWVAVAAEAANCEGVLCERVMSPTSGGSPSGVSASHSTGTGTGSGMVLDTSLIGFKMQTAPPQPVTPFPWGPVSGDEGTEGEAPDQPTAGTALISATDEHFKVSVSVTPGASSSSAGAGFNFGYTIGDPNLEINARCEYGSNGTLVFASEAWPPFAAGPPVDFGAVYGPTTMYCPASFGTPQRGGTIAPPYHPLMGASISGPGVEAPVTISVTSVEPVASPEEPTPDPTPPPVVSGGLSGEQTTLFGSALVLLVLGVFGLLGSRVMK